MVRPTLWLCPETALRCYPTAEDARRYADGLETDYGHEIWSCLDDDDEHWHVTPDWWA